MKLRILTKKWWRHVEHLSLLYIKFKITNSIVISRYIAPEILLRIPYTNRVDCWAVGVIGTFLFILYQFLTRYWILD